MSTALQNAWEAIDAAMPEHPSEWLLLIRAKCRGLIAGYDARWCKADYQPIQVDHLLTSDLTNPETMRTSRTWTVAGLLDLLCKSPTSRRVLFDHKTTSQDITDPNGPYWRQLMVEGQANHYALLDWVNGGKIEDIVWDVVRKPGIKPKQIAKAERASLAAGGMYCGYRLTNKDRMTYAQGEERETLTLYEARLTKDCLDEPQWYFQRRSIMRSNNEIWEYARELWQHGQNILATRNDTTPDRLPPRNSGACMLYGSPCKFLGICSGFDSPDSGKWTVKEKVHNELPTLEGDGRGVLTNSRIRCYQTCQRKHYYQYELGIERVDDDEREALVFGSLYHAGLAGWWKTFLEESVDEHRNAGYPAIGVGSHGGTVEPQLVR